MWRIVYLLGVLTAPSLALAHNTRSAELEYADAELNKVYSSLIRQLARVDQVALRAAQRAWISFREKDCNIGWADRRDCLIARTQERTEQLRDSLFWTPDGRPIDLSGAE